MCIVTFSPVEKVRILEKGESDKNRFVTYFGEVYIKTQEVSFLKAVLVGLAPSFLSYWFFIYLLDIFIHNQVHIVTLFFLIFIMISLIFSANPSQTDLELIPEAFDNDEINNIKDYVRIVNKYLLEKDDNIKKIIIGTISLCLSYLLHYKFR